MNVELRTKTGKTFQTTLRCVVFKFGSAVLSREFGHLDRRLIASYAKTISDLIDNGLRVVIVSSGAISAGIGEMSFEKKPESIPEKQALAAIGQSKLMNLYSEVFARHGKKVAQILLTRDDMEDRRRFRNVRYTLDKLYALGVVPIINENDTITIDELKFGDNDILSAIVASKLDADMLIMLTVVDGLYMSWSESNRPEDIIPLVDRVTPRILKMVSSSKSPYGTGGMLSKLKAAEYAGYAGIYTIIANGKKPGILERLFAGDIDGTLFLPGMKKRLSSRKRWIAFGKSGGSRRIVVDAGARKALVEQGRSLLPVGIKHVEGGFKRGDVVLVYDEEEILLGKGIINFSSHEIQKIKGLRTSNISAVLGAMDYEEVIHRDNFVLLIDT